MAIAAMPAVFVFLWSTGFLGGKYGLPYAPPMTFLAIRFVCAAALLLVVSVAMQAPWPREPKFILHIAIAGLLVHATYIGGVFVAMSEGFSTGLVALVVGMQPLLTALLVGPLLSERVTRRQWTGLAIGFAGVALVVANKVAASSLAGIGPAVLALLGITFGTLYQKRYCGPMDLRTGTVVQYTASALATGTLALLFDRGGVQWTGEFMFAVAWLVIVLSMGAVTLLFVMIRRGVASKVASLFYLTPPVTALLGYLLLGERLGAGELIGMAGVVGGVYLVVRA
jgi:drug/metabolite transporter (DMT)-like permease